MGHSLATDWCFTVTVSLDQKNEHKWKSTDWCVTEGIVSSAGENRVNHYMKQRGMYRVRRVFVFLVNRVEHQKRTQTATKWWPFGFVFGVQLGLRHTQALINI